MNKDTKDLFKIAKNPKEMLDLGEKNLKKFIKTIGLYNSKAKNIILLRKNMDIVPVGQFGGNKETPPL